MFAQNLRDLRRKKNLTQTSLSEVLNVSNGTIAMWETSKRMPDTEMLTKISNYFNVTVDYLLGNIDKKNTGTKIPVLGIIPAGIPINAIEEILDYEEITNEMAASGEYFALRVSGNSMEPKISDGDVLIVRKQDDANTGDICVVMVNGDDATVKRIKKEPTGLLLIPSNPSYETMFFTNQEIIDKPVRIIGKVVELRAKF